MELYSILILITFKSAFAEDKTSKCNTLREPMKITYPTENSFEEFISNKVKYLCSAEKEADIDNLNKIPPKFYEIKHCLYDKTFEGDGPLECEADVKPIFVQYYDEDKDKPGTWQCGPKETQKLYTFGYYHCGDGTILKEFEREEVQMDPKKLGNFATNIKIYDICFDMEEMRTIWTRHTIQHPELFKDENFKDREFYCPAEISMDPFFMEADSFVKLKQKYEVENEGNSRKTIPFYLVPLEHLALRAWKKTANHYLNTASLREHFNLIMRAIDDGIKRAAQKIYFEDTEKNNDLFIFTKVTRSTETNTTKFKKLFGFKTSESNIWYKVVYSKSKKAALMIVLHNSDEKWQMKKCKTMPCDFTKWTPKEEYLFSIDPKKLNHVYCCELTSEEAEELFSIELIIEDYLDIDAMLKRNEEKEYLA